MGSPFGENRQASVMVGSDVGASWGAIAVQLDGRGFATGRAAFDLDAVATYLDGVIIFSWNFAIVQKQESARRFFPKKITV